jgi:RimJ/RimL family protein N-acetyltransferase
MTIMSRPDDNQLCTERLDLIAWSDAATTVLARLGADPRVVRYVGDGSVWTPQRSAEVSAVALAHWRQHDFGWRVARERVTDMEIGFIALNFLGDGAKGLAADEFEIGWWLDPGAWGRGLAYEGARAVLAEAFDRLGAPSVMARIQPANAASCALAERLGMRNEGPTTARFGEPIVIFRALR